jgi:uncharacterized NAD(P)/FAD-binding protein YdhS
MVETDVAIIGGGFSGCALALQVAGRAPARTSLVLFEPGELGRGAAYGSSHVEHLLNTRAAMMSLFSDDAHHFVRWLGARGGARDFVSRRLYGDYVNAHAREVFDRSHVLHARERVRRIKLANSSFDIETESGRHFSAAAVALAIGNPPPNDAAVPPEARLHSGYVSDPWRFDYRVVGGRVLCIGSGLTTLDVLVALESSGRDVTVDVVSRRGLYPKVHGEIDHYDVVPALDTHDARSLLHSFRRHVAQAERGGFDWRCVVDALRPETEAIWRRLTADERRRFERHLRGRWERHRHRAPQQVAAVRQRYENAGRLATYAGTFAAFHRGVATIALRSGGSAELHPDWIVNCTGLAGAAGYAKDPLVSEMLAGGLLARSPDGLGLQSTVHGLWVIGPLLRGTRFEATSVPELRAIADDAGLEILQSLTRALRLPAQASS